ncbi:sulfur carrier protein ThiS [Corynebacterium bovis]|nr:sulfur carrier protein ThiS [Corynebacterium bovis]MBB3115497.1 sulfur carrier protein [Corynebacterium bovis DSM 20582 = CIP 54.80]MDH2456462.1 sulfur carrier protein ThiS [Corynebacterium bovis]MDK8510078.1 sulfur carrier protein ThiS [Corynebacterium bovis]MDN8579161.1 sulfur carrier protein ThiS [Corynebacterium bovis]
MMICTDVNGEEHCVEPATTVAELVGGIVDSTRGIAVAVDGRVLPRDRWSETLGDLRPESVDILTVVQGG